MEGWNYWDGKKVFIILKSGRKYTGKIIEVDFSAKPIIFISIIDKFDQRVTFAQSEIDVMQEERE